MPLTLLLADHHPYHSQEIDQMLVPVFPLWRQIATDQCQMRLLNAFRFPASTFCTTLDPRADQCRLLNVQSYAIQIA